MARDRNAKRIRASQHDPTLPPTRELKGGFCRIFDADVPMLQRLGDRDAPRPACPRNPDCALVRLLASCDKPLELEIGCGMGKFIAARAKNHPESHFLGIECEKVRIARTDVALRAAGIANAHVVCGQAMRLLEFCLPDASLAALHLYFPDPWPKKRHRKHRLFNAAFARQAHRVLRPGGTLNVATDHDDYFAQMREAMAADGRFESIEPLERAEDETTEFEMKFRAKNHPVNAASWKKR
ncbi:MAG: tRNA (guanosine(46)-N7)-methyltransferase TrmB [Kiritimatiellia bacterium]|jgi:tRNA (guanine-N7-)-methyltransferase